MERFVTLSMEAVSVREPGWKGRFCDEEFWSDWWMVIGCLGDQGRRVLKNTPRSKWLLSDERSNILVYMSHGGDCFLKFQDQEEITSPELADAFEQMWQRRRYIKSCS
eukprot:m.148324 g.148324  ORF g.148324 m.148324 type:complete len:108 (+) comp38495_c0_seq21:507-830(+)